MPVPYPRRRQFALNRMDRGVRRACSAKRRTSLSSIFVSRPSVDNDFAVNDHAIDIAAVFAKNQLAHHIVSGVKAGVSRRNKTISASFPAAITPASRPKARAPFRVAMARACAGRDPLIKVLPAWL